MAETVKHPLDIELVEMAEHLRTCERCRLGFARIMYEETKPSGLLDIPLPSADGA